MNATVMNFRSLIDEMKAVASGSKKPSAEVSKTTYESQAAYDFVQKLSKSQGVAKSGPYLPPTALDISALAGVTRLMSAENRLLLQIIARGDVVSISDLAAKTHRAETNLGRTVKKFEKIGVLRLVPGVGKAKVPQLAMKSFQVTVDIVAGKFSVLSAE